MLGIFVHSRQKFVGNFFNTACSLVVEQPESRHTIISLEKRLTAMLVYMLQRLAAHNNETSSIDHITRSNQYADGASFHDGVNMHAVA